MIAVVQAGKDVSYFAIVLAGFAVTGTVYNYRLVGIICLIRGSFTVMTLISR